MRLRVPLLLAGFGLGLSPLPALASAHDDHPSWTRSGDTLQMVLPLTALGLSFFVPSQDAGSKASSAADGSWVAGEAPGLNWPGPRLDHSQPVDFLVAFARSELTTYALKELTNEKRPNGTGKSFPSGHTSAAFVGAEYIRKNFGNWWGAPAYAAAAWTGYTRVQAHKHFWHDVFAGAAVGIAANYDFDDIDTPVGHLRIAPSLMGTAGDSGEPDAWRGCTSDACMETHLVPAVQFELRFW